jgi:hypothetical protein
VRLLLLQHLLCYLSSLLRDLLRNLMLSGLLSSHYSDVHKGEQQSVLTGAYSSRATHDLELSGA